MCFSPIGISSQLQIRLGIIPAIKLAQILYFSKIRSKKEGVHDTNIKPNKAKIISFFMIYKYNTEQK